MVVPVQVQPVQVQPVQVQGVSRRGLRIGRHRCALALSLIALTAAHVGCRSSRDDAIAGTADAHSAADGNDTTTAADAGAATFDVAGATTGARVGLAVTDLGDGRYRVEILLLDITDLFGVACHLTFDPAAVEIVSTKGHNVLGGDGWAPRSLVKSVAGRVLLGAARTREGGSPWAGLAGAKVGKQLWATIELTHLTDGVTTLQFDPERCLARASTYEPVALAWPTLTLRRGGL